MSRHALARRIRFASVNPTAIMSAPKRTSVMCWPKSVAACQNDRREFTKTKSASARRGRPTVYASVLVLAAEKLAQARVLRLELAQRAGLDLAHPLAGDADLGADLLEGGRFAVVQAEAGLEDVARALRQLLEGGLQLLLTLAADDERLGLAGVRVLDHLREVGLAVADGALER